MQERTVTKNVQTITESFKDSANKIGSTIHFALHESKLTASLFSESLEITTCYFFKTMGVWIMANIM